MTQPSEMEQLVHGLNDPRNQSSPDVINMIQKRIQQLQREPSAWQLGIDLLNHNEAIMRFYGALTLTIKINADWDIDKVGEDRDLVNHLLESLVSSYVRLAAIPDVPFVLQKLCTTLVAVFHKPQSAWALPIRHLTACIVANRYIAQDQIPDMIISLASDTSISAAQLRSLLMFPTTLAEQESAISGMLKEQSIRVRISNNVPDILRLLHFAATSLGEIANGSISRPLQSYVLRVTYDEVQLLEAAQSMLQLLPLWTNDIKINARQKDDSQSESHFSLFEAIVQTFLHLYQKTPLTSYVLQSLTTLEETSHKLLRKAIPGYEEHIIRSQPAKSWIEQMLAGDFDSDTSTYVNFLEACMSQVDTTSSDYLASTYYIEILKQVQSLLSCEGAPGVDDTVCQVALEILTAVTEGFSDWPEPSSYDGSMKDLVEATCNSALNKVRIPHDELSTQTQTWDVDDRAKFQDFRYDVQDYLQNAYSILGDTLIEDIAQTIVQIDSSADTNLFEAGLFGFIAFSDTFANEPERFDKYLIAVFSCNTWLTAVQGEVEVLDRVRQIMIKTIGESTGFLQRQTKFLIPCLNFLFTSLHLEASTTAASRAICTLCDSQRSMLTEALPQFTSSLDGISNIESDAKHRIYAAVGALIQALPSEDAKIYPLNHVLQRLTKHDTGRDQVTPDRLVEPLAVAVDILQTLSALGRGMRAPSDSPIDLESAIDPTSTFWLDGPGSAVQRQAFVIYTGLLECTNGQHQPAFIEAACDFLKSGFTEEHPSPFKFANSKVIELLSVYVQLECPQPDVVMATATSYLASVKVEDAADEFRALLLLCVRPLNDDLTSYYRERQFTNTEFCTAGLDFFMRMLPKWSFSLLQLDEARDVIKVIVELALVLVEQSDTLPRRTAASLFTAFFEASGQTKIKSSVEANALMNSIIHEYTPRIIGTTLQLLGGICARSDIDSLAETVKKAVQKQPLLTNKLLKEAMKEENGVLSPKALSATKVEHRARIASQIEMLRGARKTNDVIKEFWITCKGREFEYLT